MAKYTLELQSRYNFSGPKEQSVSELFQATALCEWSDDSETEKDFTFTVESDRFRQSEYASIDTGITAKTNVTSANQHKVRNDIDLYAKCGFYGSFYKYTIQKKCPADGNFKFFGVEFKALPINVDAEFFVDMNTITVLWE
jgi:hypothetical protein